VPAQKRVLQSPFHDIRRSLVAAARDAQWFDHSVDIFPNTNDAERWLDQRLAKSAYVPASGPAATLGARRQRLGCSAFK